MYDRVMTHSLTTPPRPAVPYQATLMTAEDLMANPVPNMCTELVAGHILVREPPGFLHGDVAARLLIAIGSHVNARGLGKVLASETGFTLFRNPDTVRAPDVAFIRTERMPANPMHTYPEFAPDLAVEVLSPSDRAGKVLSKVGDWLDAGARLVWVVDPVRRVARVYRADGTVASLTAEDTLDGEDVLPELRISVSAMID
jgi:Uma2 family endonuclease